MTSLSSKASALTESLEAFVAESSGSLDSLDPEIRRKLSEAARKVNRVTEATGDTVHRIIHTPLELSLAAVGVETRLFEILVEHKEEPTTTAELASKTKIDPVLLKRLLRYYQSFGMIDQLTDDQYQANNITSALVSPGGAAGVPFYLATLTPAFIAIPQFLRENNYANIVDGAHSPWYIGQRTDLEPFKWLYSRPDMLKYFMTWMINQRDGLPTFLDVVDFKKEFGSQGVDEKTPVFVDIGGNMGHQCVALRQKYPDLVGRVILQDQEQVIQQATTASIPGFKDIETQVYNFFTPQPIKGARAYYLRNILHDWPDHKCVEILKNIKSAMTQDSRILIDEMVLPEKGAPWRATQLDLAMGSTMAAMERSRADWDSLLGQAGLKILDVWKYTEQLDDSIIVVVPN
ncbi:S-adenosyl-L-methionine-dependent methyltransferase [Nemania sp. FL0916]|nr:S-adenosyl-L-methionine-dependent methyltransferase [Nemania sp. FL0916]